MTTYAEYYGATFPTADEVLDSADAFGPTGADITLAVVGDSIDDIHRVVEAVEAELERTEGVYGVANDADADNIPADIKVNMDALRYAGVLGFMPGFDMSISGGSPLFDWDQIYPDQQDFRNGDMWIKCEYVWTNSTGFLSFQPESIDISLSTNNGASFTFMGTIIFGYNSDGIETSYTWALPPPKVT